MKTPPDGLNRRAFLTGKGGTGQGAKPRAGQHCISSAVVMLLPGREDEVASRLASMAGVEMRAFENRKLVLLLEGPSSGAVGSLLARISVMEGVISANMVFEHTEPANL